MEMPVTDIFFGFDQEADILNFRPAILDSSLDLRPRAFTMISV
jgi:hypothetical protein